VLGAVLGAALLGQFSAALDEEELAVLTLINDYRAANGLAPLTVQYQLNEAAAIHSQDQATGDSGFSTHTGSDGSDPVQRFERAGYANWASWGENVAWEPSDGSASAAFVGWQNSGPHNAQMLSTDVTEIGIARAQSETGGWYWTTVFARQW
ncbi:MAG: CAP domain-containing protein, partial [Thermomicrobiales bacterium]